MKHTVGDKIRIARISRGLSQENVAEELGLSIAAYSNIERGKTKVTLSRLETLAKILKTEVFTFLDHTGGSTKVVNKDGGSSYSSVKQLEERVREMELMLENKDLEISYLKQIITLLTDQKKKAGRK